ncbi:hypothetical protein HK28_13900 [Acetobacter sp. DsW_063]|nr:hypothetical protein HK28_13900 [Acetobacter sp. DsW_063]
MPRVVSPMLAGLPPAVQANAETLRRQAIWMRQLERMAFQRHDARAAKMFGDHAEDTEAKLEAYLLPFVASRDIAAADLPANVVRFPGVQS